MKGLEGFELTDEERELERIVDRIKKTKGTLESIKLLQTELNILNLACVIKAEGEPLLSKELAEKLFDAGGDWRWLCQAYTDEKIGKVEWSEGVDFDDIWEEISNGL